MNKIEIACDDVVHIRVDTACQPSDMITLSILVAGMKVDNVDMKMAEVSTKRKSAYSTLLSFSPARIQISIFKLCQEITFKK